MPDVTTHGHAATPRGGVTGVALELLIATARGALSAQLALLRLPLLGFQQVWSVTDAVRRGSLDLAERSLHVVGLRNGAEDASLDPTGYLTEPESRNGEYAQFSPEFASAASAGAAVGVDPGMLADEDADLIAELGTDLSADTLPEGPAALAGSELSTDDLEAAVADLAAAAGETGFSAPEAPADAPVEAPVGGMDIVTRAAVAAEEAAADEHVQTVEREELPIVDFDHVTAGSLRGRLRRLDLSELQTLRTYEQEHGHRLPILTLLENRIAKLEASSTA